MERVRAGRVYISKGVLAEPTAAERARRLAAAIEAPEKRVLEDDEIERLQRALPWEALPRRGHAKDDSHNRVVFLDRMHWEREDSVFPGYGWAGLRSAAHEWRNNGVICQSAVEIQTIVGCNFDCSYCPYTESLTMTCDLEAFVDRLDDVFCERPHQDLYKLNNRSDTLSFEPEYGLTRLLVERFARATSQVLMLYSKSANVSHLMALRHEGHTIACFTLSAPSTAKLLEPSAPSFEERLDAAARCAAAGYPVRFRFSPIVPLRGWREELTWVARRLAERVRPELVTLWTLSMIDFDALGDIVPIDALDPEIVDATRAARLQANGTKGAPFPEAVRAEIYRFVADAIAEHAPTTRVALCLEAPPVLAALRDRLAIVDHRQVCNCGPRCTPTRVQAAAPASCTSARSALRLPKP